MQARGVSSASTSALVSTSVMTAFPPRDGAPLYVNASGGIGRRPSRTAGHIPGASARRGGRRSAAVRPPFFARWPVDSVTFVDLQCPISKRFSLEGLRRAEGLALVHRGGVGTTPRRPE